MIHPHGLESGLKAMKQMKSQKKETQDVEYDVTGDLELFQDEQSKIFIFFSVDHNGFRAFKKPCLYIKITQVYYEENKGNDSRMDHEFRKEGSLRIARFHVAHGSGNPVLDLNNESIENMKEETSKQ
jgi:hypothetical protein